jgi:hypothetical protein
MTGNRIITAKEPRVVVLRQGMSEEKEGDACCFKNLFITG